MTLPKTGKTGNPEDRAKHDAGPGDMFPMLCGPGCACGEERKTPKWKIAVMLIIMAAVAMAFLYKKTL